MRPATIALSRRVGAFRRPVVAQQVRVLEPGDTEFLEGENVDKQVLRGENDRMKKKKQTPSKAEPLLLGITKASLTTQSFISAASFQETTRVLTDAAIRGAKDDLLGLKENIIIGHLIPAGTGMYRYQDVEMALRCRKASNHYRRRWSRRQRQPCRHSRNRCPSSATSNSS